MAVRSIASSKVSPDFLHANSTNHTWAFSAFAELIDNSCDAKAKEMQIDIVQIGTYTCLSFQDDGIGMDREQLYNMLSFGFCGRHLTAAIGKYGNGFKSGSMRLGKDAIVFTRSKEIAGVGLLSQTYNKDLDTETVLVPMLHYRLPNLVRVGDEAHSENLTAILQNSIFEDEEKLIEQIQKLPKTGTRIIIYNLHRTCGNRYLELDFDTDPADIRCPENYDDEYQYSSTSNAGSQYLPTYKVSLKEYCSILYLHPRIKIRLRGASVKTRLIAKSLCNTQMDEYIPKGVTTSSQHCNRYAQTAQRNTITFGFLPDSTISEDYGMMLYSDNRLIKPYEKVSCQRRGNGVGAGVVGVTEAKFLTPTNMKQDFVRDEKYRSAMAAYNTKLKNYWDSARAQPSNSKSRRFPDSVWAQCEFKSCLKWRRLPPGTCPTNLPDKWYCYMHPDHITCDLPEDMHEDEDITVAPSRLRLHTIWLLWRQRGEVRNGPADNGRQRSVRKRSSVPEQSEVINGKRSRHIQSSVPEDTSSNSSEHSSHSLSTGGKVRASTRQNAHSEHPNSSHLLIMKTPIRGTGKKTSQVKNSKAVRGSLCQKTREVTGKKTKSEAKKSVADQVATATNDSKENSHHDGDVRASEEAEQGAGDDDVDTFLKHGSKIDYNVGLSATDEHGDNVRDTEHDDSITDVTVDNEHDNDDVVNTSVDAEPKSDDNSSLDSDDDVDETASMEAREELSQLRNELNQLRERYQNLLRNIRRLLQMLVPDLEINEDVNIEQMIAALLEHNSGEDSSD